MAYGHQPTKNFTGPTRTDTALPYLIRHIA